MEEQLPHLLAIAILTLAAVTMGMVMVRLKQPPLVGYILAGVVLGPAVLGFVPRVEAVPLVAEIGVVFLLFLVGMEISLKAFIADLKPAALTVLGQLLLAIGTMLIFASVLDWTMQQALLLAFVVTMSSTAVALKILEDIGELRSELGRIVVAVMIAQDIAIVPMLILANSWGSGISFEPSTLVTVVLAVGGLAVFIGVLGPRGKLHFPGEVHIMGRVEMVTLTALAVCCSAATLSGVLGFSPAYGAFLAGLLVGKTTLRTEAIDAMEPIQGVLMVLFFVAIGLLLDVDFILSNLVLVGLFVVGVLIVKSLANIAILRLVGCSWTDAYQAGLIIGQIGEFSFVLAAVGLANGVLDAAGYKLAISVIVLSLLLSPIWMSAVKRVHGASKMGMESLRLALVFAYSDEVDDVSRAQAAMVRGFKFSKRVVGHPQLLQRYASRMAEARRQRVLVAKAEAAAAAAKVATTASEVGEGTTQLLQQHDNGNVMRKEQQEQQRG
ncbi:MAG: cation:proton antiporter [Hyphomicrobiaceae bacterium]|nr:cation:proton antiporter [Hyphomicrobiaceae bacterium]MCC0010397.1 cation:proton antiporter [Hyphomicrobiaceae bacterium]